MVPQDIGNRPQNRTHIFVEHHFYSVDCGNAGVNVDWDEVSRSGQATVVGGALVAIGTVLPWMSYSGGSASLLQDGKMEVVLSNGMSSSTSTVASSQTMIVALLLAAVAVGLPLVRGWDWKSSLPTALLGLVALALFGLSALLLHGGGQDGVLVDGNAVAETATPGTGLYAGLVGATLITLAAFGHVVSAAVGRLRS